ncbi:MAG: RNA polymerase sigma factor (sigma-70 family) [Planctomycetota bacterium]|jgi:RNA polymerase sigma factor (sigma-70 family)
MTASKDFPPCLMMNFPDDSVTTTALLNSLFDLQESTTWAAYEARLRPVLFGTARRMGLDGCNADEVVQDCLVDVIKGYRKGNYSRDQGRLKSWILAILRNRVRDHFRSQNRQPDVYSESIFYEMPGPDELNGFWTKEAQAKIAIDALARLRRETGIAEKSVTAFELHILRGKDVNSVAVELNMGVAAVYKACQRCTTRFQEMSTDIQEAYGFDL